MSNDAIHFMRRALDIAEHARLSAPPNPWVGCVLVNNGVVVGEGYTQPPGQAHAEIMALRHAGDQAQGATAYVTLEPCAHHGRTPPCIDALIRAGIIRVVAAIEDPDSKVAGNGFAALRAAGIAVEVGLLAEEVHQQLRPYLFHRKTGLPYCVLKAAVSLDGRVAAQDGSSQWITCPAARNDVHRLRAESQAILVGVNTAIRDNCSLTVRHYEAAGMRQPLRIVLDTQGRLPLSSPLWDTTHSPTLLVTSAKSVFGREHAGVEILPMPLCEDGIDLQALLKQLGSRGILQLLVEGGSKVFSSFLKQGLANQLCLYVGPRLLGDKGLPLVEGLSIPNIAEAPLMQAYGCTQFDSTIRIDYSIDSSKLFK